MQVVDVSSVWSGTNTLADARIIASIHQFMLDFETEKKVFEIDRMSILMGTWQWGR
jgi:hypothetical protein